MTDQAAGTSFTSGFDDAGRINSVSSIGYGGEAKQFASQMKYRAWGGLKSLAYGNTKTLAVGYNEKLQPTSYEVPGVMKKSYQYNADSRLRFTQDQLTVNSKLDRSYEYDHMGRVTKALSGAEARGQAPTEDRPYNETLTYDAMNHMNSRETYYWDRHDASGVGTYANNRRAGWDHRDPSGAGFRGTNATGQWTGAAEMDPMGADAGLIKPLEVDPPDKVGLLEPYPEIADMLRNPGGGCVVDRMPIPCEILNRLMEAGGVRSEYPNEPLAREPAPGGRWRPVRQQREIKYHGLGLFEIWMPPEFRNEYSTGGWVVYLIPQNRWGPRLTEDEYLAIRKEIVKALESERCRKFIDTLVRYNSGQHIESQEELPAFADYIFNSQDGGIFWSSSINVGGIQIGRKMRIGSRIRPDLNVVSNAAGLMHELIHGLQGPGSDDQLDRALRDLGIVPKDSKGQPLPFPTGMRDGKPYNDWSGYWDQALKDACFPVKQ